jgi:hypothetical protein
MTALWAMVQPFWSVSVSIAAARVAMNLGRIDAVFDFLIGPHRVAMIMKDGKMHRDLRSCHLLPSRIAAG